MKTIQFAAPADFPKDTDGLFLGGGWLQLKGDKRCITVPAEGNWSALTSMGFTEVPAPAEPDVAAAPVPKK